MNIAVIKKYKPAAQVLSVWYAGRAVDLKGASPEGAVMTRIL